MSLFEKLEADVEIKAQASKFHEMIHKRPHHITMLLARKCKVVSYTRTNGVKLVVSSVGTIFMMGKLAKVGKEVIEADFMEHYKTFKVTIQVIPKDEGSVVHYTLEYEKLHKNIPDSHTSLLQLFVDVSKDMDAHLMKGN